MTLLHFSQLLDSLFTIWSLSLLQECVTQNLLPRFRLPTLRVGLIVAMKQSAKIKYFEVIRVANRADSLISAITTLLVIR